MCEIKTRQGAELHRFKQGDHCILLDVCGGGVYVVDEQIYNALGDCDYSKTPEYAELCEAGLFKDKDDYAQYADMNVKAPLKAICLQVSHECNLRCGYCFAEDVVSGETSYRKGIMSPETAKKAVDFLIRGSRERKHLEIDFFGGEPLLAWDAITQAVEYAKKQGEKHEKQFKFTITTNGILLDDEKSDFINREMNNIVMSLDGRRETNDRFRKCVNGKGSYDLVLPKFKKLVDSRIGNKKDFTDYFIRGTYTSFNLDFANDVLKIAEEGFKHISIEPVTAEPHLSFALKTEHLPRIKDEYDKLFEIMLVQKPDWSFFHFCIDLTDAPCILKRLRGCGAGNEYIAITPDGSIFPCHRYVGIETLKMGNINDERFFEEHGERIKAYFAKTHIYAKSKCKTCWARFYCGGGCNAEFYIFEGDANVPSDIFCELMKKRIECALALTVAEKITENL
ncbi:MAG: thioether cross-link-forming SCIFF peptide maturase [Oscillospiraceae bacterium]|nr:thioether cross-link-forming SCIFF peptide maturase [Oscillospiraceae bacterium]